MTFYVGASNAFSDFADGAWLMLVLDGRAVMDRHLIACHPDRTGWHLWAPRVECHQPSYRCSYRYGARSAASAFRTPSPRPSRSQSLLETAREMLNYQLNVVPAVARMDEPTSTSLDFSR
jgi:hypothetical protein